MVEFVFLAMAKRHMQWVGNEDSAFLARPVKCEKGKLLTGRVTGLTFFANEGREQLCDLSKTCYSTC